VKSGFVTFLGRPNAGKSTLINTLLDQKIVIVSDKPQTTWHRINCIYTDDSSQIVFTDTPGVHKPVNNINRYMLKAVNEALEGMDLIIWLIDTSKGLSKGEDYVFEKIKDVKTPYLILLNKIDLIEPDKVQRTLKLLKEKYRPSDIFPVSGNDQKYRGIILKEIKKYLKEGGFLYPEDVLTDRSNKFLVSEIIREKIFRLTYDEIPYSCAVFVEHFSDSDDQTIDIRAEIWVERKTQKGMIIGKGAQNIKKIRLSAKRDIQFLFDRPVSLELYVRVKEEWRSKDYLLNNELYFT